MYSKIDVKSKKKYEGIIRSKNKVIYNQYEIQAPQFYALFFENFFRVLFSLEVISLIIKVNIKNA